MLEIEIDVVNENPWWTLPENSDVPLVFFMEEDHVVAIETFIAYALR